MKSLPYSLILIFLTMMGCQKNDTPTVYDILINNKGWYAVEYLRVDIGQNKSFQEGQPYIILGEYGSGLKFNSDGICHIQYSDGTAPIKEGTITKNWNLVHPNEILFTQAFSDSLSVELVDINQEFLWIKYEQANDRWEYKLSRIE